VIPLSEEQQRAYKRFITARDKVGMVRTQGYSKRKWIRHADVVCTVDIAGYNHPFFEPNDDWQEYKEASMAWWTIEPEFRKAERMSAIRGDYGTSDNWDEGTPRIRDTYSIINEEEQQQ
jgi:hypothetical protein